MKKRERKERTERNGKKQKETERNRKKTYEKLAWYMQEMIPQKRPVLPVTMCSTKAPGSFQ